MSESDEQDGLRALEALRHLIRISRSRQVAAVEEIAPGALHLTFVEVTIMSGDTFINKDSIAANQGRGQTNVNTTQNANLNQAQHIDFAAMVPQLERLREELGKLAKTLEEQEALGLIASAQRAAEKGEQSKFWEIMKALGGGAGKWVAEVAGKIGAQMVKDAILGGPPNIAV